MTRFVAMLAALPRAGRWAHAQFRLRLSDTAGYAGARFAPAVRATVMARIFTKKLEQELGQPVIIENRSGAGGNIAGEFVARSAPDGYTLLLANSGILAANASLYKRTGFDAERDFTPITLVGAQANVLVINPGLRRRRSRSSSHMPRPIRARSATRPAVTAPLLTSPANS